MLRSVKRGILSQQMVEATLAPVIAPSLSPRSSLTKDLRNHNGFESVPVHASPSILRDAAQGTVCLREWQCRTMGVYTPVKVSINRR